MKIERFSNLIICLLFFWGASEPIFAQKLLGPMRWINEYVTPLKINCFVKDKKGAIYAGTGHGVYKTTDHGNRWRSVALLAGNIWPLGVDSNQSVIAGAGKYFLSKDEGKSWKMLSYYFESIATDRFGNLFAKNNASELWESVDGGETWKRLSTQNKPTPALYLLIDSSETIYSAGGTASYSPYIYKSTNLGTSWEHLSFNDEWGGNWAISSMFRTIDGILVVGTTYGGVHISRDNGITWTRPLFNGADVCSIYADSGASTILVACENVLHSSWDGGKTWSYDSTIRWDGFYNFWDGTPCLVQDTNSKIFLGTSDKGIWDSYDKGHTWKHHNSGASGMIGSYCLSADPNDSTLLMGTDDGIYHSTHFYTQWTNLDTTTENLKIQSLSSPAKNLILFASGDSICRSVDHGASWSLVLRDTGQIPRLYVDTITHFIYSYDSLGILFKSQDSGLHWIKLISGIAIGDRLTSFSSSGLVLIGTQQGVVLESQDSGVNWITLGSPLKGKVICLSLNSVGLLVGTDSCLFIWNDTTRSWSIPIGWPSYERPKWITHNSKEQLIVHTGLGRIYASVNGQKWVGNQSDLPQFKDFFAEYDRLFAVDDSSRVFLINAILGISGHEEQDKSITVYPNPCSERNTFTIQLPDMTQLANTTIPIVELTNIFGVNIPIVTEGSGQGNEFRIRYDSNLPNGVYFVRVSSTKNRTENVSIMITK